MSDVNFYGQRGQLVKSWNFNIDRNKENLWTINQTFYCHRDDVVALMPARGVPHPDYPFVRLDSVTVNGMEGDWVDIKAKYAGLDPDDPDDPDDEEKEFSYGLRMTTGEEPVSTAPYFDEVPEKDKNEAVKLATQPPKNKDGSVKKIDTKGWDKIGGEGEDEGNKLELYQMVQKGIEAYLEPRIEYFERYTATFMPSDLNDIGKRGAIPPKAPQIADNRSWLFVGYNITEKAPDVFDIERTWQLSGRGGWNEKIYDKV